MKSLLIFLNYSISFITAGFYALLLIGLFIEGDYKSLLFSVLIPSVGVVICSVLRAAINAPRPYEVNKTENLIGKKTTGKSFPSRHVFSIFIIASTVFIQYRAYGIFLYALGIALCVLRVKSGVHFVKDVLAGAILGMLLGILPWILIL